MLRYDTRSYWALEAFWTGRLSIVENLTDHPNNSWWAQKHEKECKRKILKNRTAALVSEDREACNDNR